MGAINEISVLVSKPLDNGGWFDYTSNLSTSINLTSAEFFCIRCEYKLASVTDLT